LQITNGGPEGQDYFIVRDHPAQDPKLNRFAPRFVVDMKTRMRTYREPDEYLFPRMAASVAAVQRAADWIGIGGARGDAGTRLSLGTSGAHHGWDDAGRGAARRYHRLGDSYRPQRRLWQHRAGKYADLVVLDRDPLKDISNSLSIAAVMEGGACATGGHSMSCGPNPGRCHAAGYCDDARRRTGSV